MTPIGPEEDVAESEVMNVIGPDGVTRRFHRRAWGTWLFKNGTPSNDFLQIAIRVFTVGKLMVGFVVALGGMFWGLNEYWILPQQAMMIEKTVAAQIAPIAKRLDVDEELFRQHLIDIANQRSIYPTKEELRDDLNEIKSALIRLEERR